MLKPVVLTATFFIMVSNFAFGQDQIPNITLGDTITTLVNNRWNTDSLRILSWSDSIREKVTFQFSLDSIGFKDKADSLRGLNLSDNVFSAKLDSLIQKKDQMLQGVNAKQEQLLKGTRAKLEKWETSVRTKIGEAGFPGKEHLPDMDIGVDLPDLQNDGITLKTGDVSLPELPALSSAELQLPSSGLEFPTTENPLSINAPDKLSEIKEQFGGVSEKIGAIEGLTENPGQAIDQSLESVSQLEGVKDELALADGIRDNEFMEAAEALKDPDALKEEVKQQVVKKAVNHFAGKEEVLQQAMEKISKYKQKYESLNSLSELKKRPPNPMKGKPLRERLVPGVVFQILNNESILLDINPNLGYRVTGRLTTGAGWNQRIGYSTRHNYFTSVSIIYGPRMFTEYKVWRGFSGRVEFEWMNTFVPPLLKPAISADNGNREWVFTTMVGIKKEYRFMKSVKGTMFMMFNLYDPKHKSPYGDVVISRFGFAFILKQKKKTSRSESSL